MRVIFIIALVVTAVLFFVNVTFLPGKQRQAKEMVDRHLNSFPVKDTEEMTFKGHIRFLPSRVYAEDYHLIAGYGKWNQVQFNNITLDIKHIEYNADSIFKRSQMKVDEITGIVFSGEIPFSEISHKYEETNENLKNETMYYDGGHLFLKGYFVPLKSTLELDGDLILTPDGKIKYQVRKVKNLEGEEVDSKEVLQMIDDMTELSMPVDLLESTVAVDELEVKEYGAVFKGHSEDAQ